MDDSDFDESDSDDFLSPGSRKYPELPPSPILPKTDGIMKKKVDAIKSLMTGVPPPPEKTNPDFDLNNIMRKYYKSVDDYKWEKGGCEEVCHKLGITLNVDSSCEEMELLFNPFTTRFVFNETFAWTGNCASRKTESAKKRQKTNGWAASPRTRLSYLAKRRRTFSVVSPTKNRLVVELGEDKNAPGILKPKRVLFRSPEDTSANYKTPECGRSRPKVIGGGRQGSPLKRSSSTTPGSEKRRCSRSLFTNPEQTPESGELSKAHRQKLIWAVAGALRDRGLSTKSDCYKTKMGQLYKITHDAWMGREASEKSGSTSDMMLEVARRMADTLGIGVNIKETAPNSKENWTPKRKRKRESPSKRTPLKESEVPSTPKKTPKRTPKKTPKKTPNKTPKKTPNKSMTETPKKKRIKIDV